MMHSSDSTGLIYIKIIVTDLCDSFIINWLINDSF